MSIDHAPVLSCPSAQPGMQDAQVLGVIAGPDDAPRLAYFNAHLPATPELLGQTAPIPATQVLRLAATCEENRCAHYDGRECQLATRIVRILSPVTEVLPACVIRRSCRWHAQEGAAACLRCPQIVTSPLEQDEGLRRIAAPASSTRSPHARLDTHDL